MTRRPTINLRRLTPASDELVVTTDGTIDPRTATALTQALAHPIDGAITTDAGTRVWIEYRLEVFHVIAEAPGAGRTHLGVLVGGAFVPSTDPKRRTALGPAVLRAIATLIDHHQTQHPTY